MKNKLNWIFLPLALFYGAVTSVRNYLFDVNILKKYQPPVFSIVVGNLQVGGTGKTPHIEHLIRLFLQEKVMVLSRGYGRKTTGFLKADQNSTPGTVGDEPHQIFLKYGDKVAVVVDGNRRNAIKRIMDEENPTVILLDDAFQHRYVQPELNILLTTFDELFTNDFLMPVGRMRERAGGAARADAIVVTKSPETLSENQRSQFEGKIGDFIQRGTPVFFSNFSYSEPISYADVTFDNNVPVISICGIAKPAYFTDHCEKKYQLRNSYEFADHFDFTRKSLNNILSANTDCQYITTEKDVAKISTFLTKTELKRFFYVAVTVRFLEGDHFDELVLRSFKSFRMKASV